MTPSEECVKRAREILRGVNFIDDDYDEEHRERAIMLVATALQEKEEELSIAKRALFIESSEPLDRSQEAAHYNWLDNQNEKLKADLAAARERVRVLEGVLIMAEPIVGLLIARNPEYKEPHKVYAAIGAALTEGQKEAGCE